MAMEEDLKSFARKLVGVVNTLAALVKRMDEVRVDAGTVLWTPGERADGAMFIVKGRATSTWNDGASVQKVGGGYIFVHHYLLEYFAAQYVTSALPAEAATLETLPR